jgi:hypothetical protein
MTKIDWLDRMAFRQIERVHAVSGSVVLAVARSDSQAEASKSDKLYLYVDLPKFDFPVVFSEQVSKKGISMLMARKVPLPSRLSRFFLLLRKRHRILPPCHQIFCPPICISGGHLIRTHGKTTRSRSSTASSFEARGWGTKAGT